MCGRGGFERRAWQGERGRETYGGHCFVDEGVELVVGGDVAVHEDAGFVGDVRDEHGGEAFVVVSRGEL